MVSLQIIDSILILVWFELISYDFRHFLVQSRGLDIRYMDIAKLRRHRVKEEEGRIAVYLLPR